MRSSPLICGPYAPGHESRSASYSSEKASKRRAPSRSCMRRRQQWSRLVGQRGKGAEKATKHFAFFSFYIRRRSLSKSVSVVCCMCFFFLFFDAIKLEISPWNEDPWKKYTSFAFRYRTKFTTYKAANPLDIPTHIRKTITGK